MIKNGREVQIQPPPTRDFRPTGTHDPIEADRVIGVDTESFTWDGKLTTTLIPAHTIEGPRLIELSPGDSPIVSLFDWLMEAYGIEEPKPSLTRQRTKESRAKRKGGSDGRDGRRMTVDPLILVWYNAEYDLGRLLEKEASILRAVSAGDDSLEIPVGEYRLEIVFLCPTGSAPSFEWYVRRNRQVIRLIGRDMWGYWKQGLEATAKALGVSAKIHIGEQVEDVFARDWLSLSEEEKESIKRYALQDSKTTREIYLSTVQLLTHIDPRVIRKDGTIPASAPGAAAKLAFAKAFDQADDLEVWHRPPMWISQLGLMAYAGGRVFCRRPGPVEKISVLDITSAYPDAMRWLPDPARCQYHGIYPGPFDVDEFKGKWGVLVISGEGLDPHIPALRRHDPHLKRLQYIYGAFREVPATIPEIVIGVLSGRLRVDWIHGGAWIDGSADTSFLRSYVTDVFHIKETSEKDSPLYLLSKLLINALYGKLIEVREVNRTTLGGDGFYMFPNVTALDDPDFVKMIRDVYILGGIPALEDFRHSIVNLYPVKYGEPPEIPLKTILTSTQYEAGHYFLPMHAAQVTGFVSAKLGLAAHCTQALQGDTDSIFTCNPAGLEEYHRLMEIAGYPAPRDGLGSFGLEIKEADGVLVKTKMYSLRTKGGKWKQAHHGIIKLLPPVGSQDLSPARRKALQAEQLHMLMIDLVDPEGMGQVEYKTKGRPVRLKAALRKGLTPGLFYQETRSVSLTSDPNTKLVDGFVVWKNGEEIELDRLASVHAWEAKQERRRNGAAYSVGFRRTWLYQIGKIRSSAHDPADIPPWVRAARTAKRAVALDTLTAKRAVPDAGGRLTHPLETLGEFYPGWLTAESEILTLLWEHSPARKSRPRTIPETQTTIFQ